MRRKNVIIGGSVILLAVLVIVQFRALILTPVWHWRHGDSVKIGSYQFPVARNWVPTYETGDSAMLVEVARKRGKNSWPPPTITLMVLRTQRPIDLGFWESVQQQVVKRNGSVIVDSRSFAFDGETLKCLNLGDILQTPKIPLDSLSCQSTGGLEVLFSGTQTDSAEFYELLRQVHRLPVR